MPEGLVKHIFENVRDFNTEHIFDCGQCFRWAKQDDGSYSGIVEGAFANVAFYPKAIKDPRHSTSADYNIGTVVIWSNLFANLPLMREKFWRNYLDLDRDYGAVKRLFVTEDNTMAKAVRVGSGIRILNQNKWETLISFIISQNNNIPRIKNCIETLCRTYGKKIGTVQGKPFYAFPTMECMAELTERDLDICRLGYRARYLVETARQVAYDGGAFLETGEQIPTEKIEQYLLSLSGVGPKVANCIMLFSMKKSEIFPIDVWIKRVMSRCYGMSEENVHAMKEYAERNFGEYGGIAQQYLFYYIRNLSQQNPVLYSSFGLEEENNS